MSGFIYRWMKFVFVWWSDDSREIDEIEEANFFELLVLVKFLIYNLKFYVFYSKVDFRRVGRRVILCIGCF